VILYVFLAKFNCGTVSIAIFLFCVQDQLAHFFLCQMDGRKMNKNDTATQCGYTGNIRTVDQKDMRDIDTCKKIGVHVLWYAFFLLSAC
jgi:hypothetical protein